MIVSEIGLNHLGNIKFLNKYINKLSKTKIDSITLQILKKQDLKVLKILLEFLIQFRNFI